jgi:hypothetical protein
MTAPNPPDSTSSSTPPGTLPPAAVEPVRFGADAPEWARGKTPAELNATLEQLAALAQRGLTQPQAQPPQQSGYQPSPYTATQAAALMPPGPDDYVTGQHIQQYRDQVLQQAQGYANPAIEMAASGNLDRVKEKYSKEFAKYGPEIFGLISRIPKTDWSIDTLANAVKVTLAGHLDELVNDRVAQFQSSQDPALRSSGANGSTAPSTQALDQGLTDAQKERLRRQGITEQVVADFAAKKGMTPQRWYETAGKHLIGEGV